MTLFKKFAIGISSFVTLTAMVLLSLFLYEKHEQNKREIDELGYFTNSEWKRHDEYRRIQISTNNESNKSTLRKVAIDREYIVYARKKDDYTLSAAVLFPTVCIPNSTIETRKKYSDNSVKELECNSDGDALFHSSSWNTENTDLTWSENLDGFSFHIEFNEWDFTQLEKEITLKKQELNDL